MLYNGGGDGGVGEMLCNFSPNYPTLGKKGKRYNVIVFVLFRLKQTYKDFSQYMNGLKELHLYVKDKKLPHNIKFRIYWNKSIYDTNNKTELVQIKNTMKIANENPNIQLVEYRDGLSDRGIFPFFIRYFPLFNFPDNDTEYVFSTDIDFTENDIQKGIFSFYISYFTNIIEKKMNFIYLSSKCYLPFWKSKIDNNKIVLLGSNIGGGEYKFDKTILLHFIYSCINQTTTNKVGRRRGGAEEDDARIKSFYIEYIKYIKNPNINPIYKHKKQISYNVDKTFIYGLDEFFLTYYLFPIVLSTNKLKVYQSSSNVASGGLGVFLDKIFVYLLRPPLSQKNVEWIIILINQSYGKYFKIKYSAENIKIAVSDFLRLFKKHDYLQETPASKVMTIFLKKIKNLIDDKEIVLSKDLKNCLFENDKYYDDTNNLHKLTKNEKLDYLYQLQSNI